MKVFIITISFTKPAFKRVKIVKSESAMWRYLHKQQESLTKEEVENGVHVKVVEAVNDDTRVFKDFSFKINSKSKIIMW